MLRYSSRDCPDPPLEAGGCAPPAGPPPAVTGGREQAAGSGAAPRLPTAPGAPPGLCSASWEREGTSVLLPEERDRKAGRTGCHWGQTSGPQGGKSRDDSSIKVVRDLQDCSNLMTGPRQLSKLRWTGCMPLGCFPPFLKLEVPALVPLLYSRRSSGGLWWMKSSGCFHVEAETIRGGSLDTAPLDYNKLLRKENKLKKKSFILSADAASLILNAVEVSTGIH